MSENHVFYSADARIEQWIDSEEWLADLREMRQENPFDDFDGYVYIIECKGVFKIGRTRNITRRIDEFSRTLMPFDFKLVLLVRCRDAGLAERTIHYILKHLRIRGEWFQLDATELIRAQVLILQFSKCRDRIEFR